MSKRTAARLVFAAALAGTSGAQAQVADGFEVFGIALGKPISAPPCSKAPVAHATITAACVLPPAGPKGEWTYNIPAAQAPYWFKSPVIRLRVDSGAVEGIDIDTTGVDAQDAIMAVVDAKFGKRRGAVTMPSPATATLQFRYVVADWANDSAMAFLIGAAAIAAA
jgi:hypothetical protein